MPTYHIETDDGDDLDRDEEGTTFPDVSAARLAALAALPDMARDKLPDSDYRQMRVTVRDHLGTRLYTATMTVQGSWF